MAVPPPASWIYAPLDIYSTNDSIYFTWWCGASADVVTGCTVTIYNSTGTAYTTDVTTQGEAYTWSFRRPVDTLGVTSGNHYTIMVYGYNTEGHGDAATAVVYFYDRPIVSVNYPTPNEVITELPLTVSWSVSDATGIARQYLWLHDSHDSTKLYKILLRDARTYRIDEASGVMTNGETYRLTIRVVNGVDLSSDTEVLFSTAWTPPASPTATVQVDEDAMAANITVSSGDGDGTEPATASLMVTRVSSDGTRWVVGSELAIGDTVTDPLPPLGMPFSYEVSAFTDAGGIATTTVPVIIETDCWTMNCGQNAELVQKLQYTPTSSWAMEHGGSSYHFADGGTGEGLPVFYPTDTRDQSGTLSYHEIDGNVVDTIRKRSMVYPVIWLRDPLGHRWRAHAVPSYTRELGPYWKISISWDAVRWKEAW